MFKERSGSENGENKVCITGWCELEIDIKGFVTELLLKGES